ncbi:cutinase-domain-containing protein [Bombardia bombarda]|uniref:Cutinase-domain-containing protein n=1 Tax=Bombardia bombarda TaxID=252184 RepID=A0AA40C1L5_9PEZI|nr:cutinase-domain-containing protein [Bombardia bombarda]
MKDIFSRAITAVAALSGAVKRDVETPCATGIHIIVARGSIEKPGLGQIGVVAGNVTALVPGSTVVAVDYPATFENYLTSEASAASVFSTQVAEYAARCPNTSIALLGYSQGGQAVMDSLCGNSEAGFTPTLDLDAMFDSHVVAAVTFGDPSHTVGAPWNLGTSNKTGIFPRLNITACEPFSDQIAGWCDFGDVYCDRGNNSRTHGTYFANYTMDAASFIVKKWMVANNVTSLYGSPNATVTTVPSSATGGAASTAASSAATATATTVISAAGAIKPSVVAAAGWLGLAVLYMACQL